MSPGRTTFAAIVMVMIGCQESGFAPTDDDLGPQFFHGASPGIAIVPASALTGPSVCRGGFGSPQCLAFPYDTGSNLAYQGNGFAAPAVALNNIGGIFSAIHEPEYANDGLYGNGASWIAGSANSWVKIDLGRVVLIDEIRFGRDRNPAGFNDRDPGQFTIAVATSDTYANGDDTNDGSEYTQVFSSATHGFSGLIIGPQTVQASFDDVLARFIKLSVTNGGAAIDEVEVSASFDGLCAFVQDFVTHTGVANSMCAKIRAAERGSVTKIV